MNNDPNSFSVDPKFWQSLTEEEWQQVWANDGDLTGELAERMWRMGEMQGDPPERIRVLVSRADIERLLPRDDGTYVHRLDEREGDQ